MNAGVLSRAFKFADNSNVFFQCQVALSLKEKYDSGKCPRPQCAAGEYKDASGQNAAYTRKRRSLQYVEQTFDLTAEPIYVNDISGSEYSRTGDFQQNLANIFKMYFHFSMIFNGISYERCSFHFRKYTIIELPILIQRHLLQIPHIFDI
ncbi:unnamed protein product [Anisakis simplex]|uniref:ZP domain-containing protein n=1 Tax=Anisakis simplex TaxID=6269 RepID=A0A0M3JD29_ANISI|nr:unnamed protein product [Anisakis simplex]